MTTRENDFSALVSELAAMSSQQGDMAKAVGSACGDEPMMGKKPNPKNLRKGDDGWSDDMEDASDDAGDMSKAFSATLANGEVVEGIDATDILKALDSDMGTIRNKLVPGLFALVQSQGEMIKSLSDSVAKLRGSGTGRRSTLSVADKPAITPPDNMAKADTLNTRDFMAKAMDCLIARKIDASEAALLDAYVGRGEQPPAHIVRKVMAG